MIVHFRDVFAHQDLIGKLFFDDNLFLVAEGLLARLGQNLIPGQPLQLLPGAGRQLLGQLDDLGVRIHPHNESPALLVPSIQMGRVRKVRVAPDGHGLGHRSD